MVTTSCLVTYNQPEPRSYVNAFCTKIAVPRILPPLHIHTCRLLSQTVEDTHQMTQNMSAAKWQYTNSTLIVIFHKRNGSGGTER